MSSASQRMRFFAITDRGSTIRGAAIEVGVTPDVGYRWVKNAGLAAQRATPRVYPDGRVVRCPYAERIAKVKRPRTTYLVSDRVELGSFMN